MKLIRVGIFFVLFHPLLAAVASDAPDSYLGKAKGFLFEAKKNHHTSYIFGTIHTGTSDEQLLDQNILKLMSLSKKIYVEADISEVDKNSIIIEKNGFYENKILSTLLSENDFILYKSILVDRGGFFSLNEYERAKPWLVAMLIPIADPLIESYPLLKYGSDIQIIDFAKKNAIPLFELEGIEYQVSRFANMSDQKAHDYFAAYVELVRNRTIYRRIVNEINFWSMADYASLEALMANARHLDDPYSRFYFEHIIDTRNARFAASIAATMDKEDGGFFSLGCEHLVGAAGVLAQLSKLGFDVKRVNGH